MSLWKRRGAPPQSDEAADAFELAFGPAGEPAAQAGTAPGPQTAAPAESLAAAAPAALTGSRAAAADDRPSAEEAGAAPEASARKNAAPAAAGKAPAASPAVTPAGSPPARPIIEMKDIRKSYYLGKPNELEILHGIDLTVYPGEFVAIVGESGSGKSTLMNLIGALDTPTAGSYRLDGVDVAAATDAQLSEIRNRKIGFVFQTFNLIGRQTALKNVELPMLYAKLPAAQRTARARQLLGMVEMTDRMKHQPNELSGGQKQRVAIARAMANDPAILLADEPTGALDSATSRTVMDLFHRLHAQQGKTILLITHNPALAEECDRVLTLVDGRIVSERKGAGCHVG